MLQLFGAVFLSFLVGLTTYFFLRVPIRHIVRDWREKSSGELLWFQFISEGRTSNTAARPEEQAAAVRSLISSMSKSGKYRSRNVASLIWNKDQSDGLAKFYLGYSSNGLQGDSFIENLASSLNCRANRVEGPPEINPHGGAFARRQSIKSNSIENYPATVGRIATIIGDGEISGSIILTLDMLRPVSEGARVKSWFNADFETTQGTTAVQQSSAIIQQKGQILIDSGVRACIGAFSDSGEFSQSSQLLQSAVGRMDTMATDYRVVKSNGVIGGVWPTVTALTSIAFSVLFMVMGMNLFLGIFMIGATAAIYTLGSFPQFRGKFIAKRAEAGEIVVPSFFYISPRYWAQGKLRQSFKRDVDNDSTNNVHNAPPSNNQVFPLYGSPITEFMSMPSSSSGKNVYSDDVPRISISSSMILEDGIWLGKDGSWRDVFMPIEDLSFGAFLAGSQGSGKTNELQLTYASVSRYCSLGKTITPIWIDAKGQGAYKTYSLVGGHDSEAVLIDATNPSPGYRLALEGRRLVDGASTAEIIQNVDALVSAMQYAEGDGIKAESRQSLEFSIRLAMLLSPEEIRSLQLHVLVDADRPNIVRLAHIILKGDPNYDPSKAFLSMAAGFSTLMNKGEKLDPREKMIYDSITVLSPQYAGNKGSDSLFMPARNKLSNLMKAGAFWDHSEDRIPASIPDIVNLHKPVILNLGAFYDSKTDTYSSDFSSATSSKLIKMFTYLIWNYIKSNCSGWQDRGKYVPLFFDEAMDISHDSSGDMPNVFEEGVKEGRSRGCGWFVATQYPSQLPRAAQNAAMNLRTRVWFNVSLSADVLIGYDSLTQGEQARDFEFSQSHLSNIKNGMAFVTMKAPMGSGNTNTFTLITPDASLMAPYFLRHETIKGAVRQYDKDGLGYTRDQDKPPARILDRMY